MAKIWYKDQKYFWKGNKVERTRAKKQYKANLKYVRKIANEQAYCRSLEFPEGQAWAADPRNLDWLLGRKQRVSDCKIYSDDTLPNYYKNSQEYAAMVMLEFTAAVGHDKLNKGWKRGNKKPARKQNKKTSWTKEDRKLFASLTPYQTPTQT